MNSMRRKTFRIISVMVAVCLFQVYVLAGATTPNVVTNTNPTSAASGLMLGRLMLVGSESILVNGNSANSCTTIISGSQLQTSDDVEATVQLGSAGKLYIQPNTNLTVTFDKTSVDVKVAAGNAYVAANAGVKSFVTTPNGRTSTTAGEPGAPVSAAMGDDDKKVGVLVFLAIVGAIVISAVVLDDDDNGSPS